MAWLDALTKTGRACATRPAFPATEIPAGRLETLAVVSPSSISSTSSNAEDTNTQKRRKRCFDCDSWQTIKWACWWAGICVLSGEKVFFRTKYKLNKEISHV